MARAKKVKPEKIDGLSPEDIAKIRTAIRKVWMWSYPRKLVKQRCINERKLFQCEQCHNETRVLHVHHLEQVGDVDAGFIERLYCSSDKLKGLCEKCHGKETRKERKGDSL